MLTCPAEGCGFKTKTDRGLSVHLNHYKKAKAGLASIAKDIRRRREAGHHRQAKRRRISSPERLEFVPDIQEPTVEADLEGTVDRFC